MQWWESVRIGDTVFLDDEECVVVSKADLRADVCADMSVDECVDICVICMGLCADMCMSSEYNNHQHRIARGRASEHACVTSTAVPMAQSCADVQRSLWTCVKPCLGCKQC